MARGLIALFSIEYPLCFQEGCMPVTKAQFEASLSRIERTLIDQIPEFAASLAVSEPAYCLFLLCEDGSSDDNTPTMLIGTKPLLDACDAGVIDGIGDKSSQDKAWYPHQSITAPFPGFPPPSRAIDFVAEDTRICYLYELIEPEEIRDDPAQYRRMLTGVARELNKLDWSVIMPVTKQFFVWSTGYIGENLFEDLKNSVSDDQLRGLCETYSSLKQLSEFVSGIEDVMDQEDL
jgi:hypothetical protein